MTCTDPALWTKDPAAKLDWVWDWSAWLAQGETITTQTVTCLTQDGLTIGPATPGDGGKVTAMISGGTVGVTYAVVCHIVTSDGREDDRTIRIRVTNR